MVYDDTPHRLDDIDRRILHTLMADARNISASSMAEDLNVSGATVRNRIHRLEEAGIIRQYTTQVDFERAGGLLTNLYLCAVPIERREALAYEARAIPGVINVRSVMTGRRNLHVLAVGEDTADLQRIARRLSELGIDIADEDLVEDELFAPYGPFSPDERGRVEPSDRITLSGGASVVTATVEADAPIAGRTLADAGEDGVLEEGTLVIGIERDDEELTPGADTVIRPDDILTVLTRGEGGEPSLGAFRSPGPDQPKP